MGFNKIWGASKLWSLQLWMKFQIFNFFLKGNDVWKCILKPAPFTLIIITFYSSQTLLVVYFHEADIYTFYLLVKGIDSSKFTHGYLLSFYFESVLIMISDSVNVSTVITYKISTSVLWCYSTYYPLGNAACRYFSEYPAIFPLPAVVKLLYLLWHQNP